MIDPLIKNGRKGSKKGAGTRGNWRETVMVISERGKKIFLRKFQERNGEKGKVRWEKGGVLAETDNLSRGNRSVVPFVRAALLLEGDGRRLKESATGRLSRGRSPRSQWGVWSFMS